MFLQIPIPSSLSEVILAFCRTSTVAARSVAKSRNLGINSVAVTMISEPAIGSIARRSALTAQKMVSAIE
jgi:hypothetical protein